MLNVQVQLSFLYGRLLPGRNLIKTNQKYEPLLQTSAWEGRRGQRRGTNCAVLSVRCPLSASGSVDVATPWRQRRIRVRTPPPPTRRTSTAVVSMSGKREGEGANRRTRTDFVNHRPAAAGPSLLWAVCTPSSLQIRSHRLLCVKKSKAI